MKIWGLLILSILSSTASANEMAALDSCYDSAENSYRAGSERLITMYEKVEIDRYDFEKAREELTRLRDARIQHCADAETDRLRVQLQLINSNNAEVRNPASSQKPVILPSGYEEIQSTHDTPE